MGPILILLLLIVLILLSVRAARVKISEEIKHLSDKLLLWLLRVTSQFERELTRDGKSEQRMWRELRLRDLQGLRLRSRQRLKEK
ncbi:MAG: hypothetical protein HY695_20610 [Deltaproteobacteria bacterium]|nr:hypothetical protein [Deltaproteobacteria bacterium]